MISVQLVSSSCRPPSFFFCLEWRNRKQRKMKNKRIGQKSISKTNERKKTWNFINWCLEWRNQEHRKLILRSSTLWCRSGLVSQELLVLYPLLSTLCLMLQRRKRKPHIKVGFVIPVKWLASYRILEERERRFIRSKRTFQIPFPSFQFLQIPFTSFQFLQFHFPSFQFLQIPLIFLQSKHNLKLYLVELKI